MQTLEDLGPPEEDGDGVVERYPEPRPEERETASESLPADDVTGKESS